MRANGPESEAVAPGGMGDPSGSGAATKTVDVAIDHERRLATVETQQQHLATRADLTDLKVWISELFTNHFRWLITVGLAVFGLVLSVLIKLLTQ